MPNVWCSKHARYFPVPFCRWQNHRRYCDVTPVIYQNGLPGAQGESITYSYWGDAILSASEDPTNVGSQQVSILVADPKSRYGFFTAIKRAPWRRTMSLTNSRGHIFNRLQECLRMLNKSSVYFGDDVTTAQTSSGRPGTVTHLNDRPPYRFRIFKERRASVPDPAPAPICVLISSPSAGFFWR